MTEIKSLENSKLISNVLELIKEEREITIQVLRYLEEISKRRLYLEMGYSSLFTFCVKHLGYTESQTQRRIEAMRLVVQMPEIESKIKEGSLNLSNVARAQGFFRQNEMNDTEKKEVLKSLENKSTRDCEKVLLSLNPSQNPLPKEKTKQITSDYHQVTLNISNELMAKLEKLKSLLSHKLPHCATTKLIEELADIALHKLDPTIAKQSTNSGKKQRSVSTTSIVKEDSCDAATLPIASASKRKYIPKKTRWLVWQQNISRCAFVSEDGKACDSTYKLQIDHKVPIAKGGTDETENLRLLCANHNQFAAIQVFSRKHMTRFVPSLK